MPPATTATTPQSTRTTKIRSEEVLIEAKGIPDCHFINTNKTTHKREAEKSWKERESEREKVREIARSISRDSVCVRMRERERERESKNIEGER